MRQNNDFLSADSRKIKEILQEEFFSHKPDPIFKNAVFFELAKKYYSGQTYDFKHQEFKKKENFFVGFFSGLFGFTRRFAFALMAIVLIASLGATTTYAYNSPEVTNKSNLYILKKSVESVELAITTAPEEKAKKFIKFADRRNAELEVLAKQGINDEETLAEINENIKNAILIAQEMGYKKEDIEKMISSNDYLADLEVVGIESIKFVEKQKGNIFVKIKNSGKITAENFLVELSWDNGLIERKTVSALASGEIKNVAFETSFEAGGNISITAKIDPANTVYEKNKDNNNYQTVITVDALCADACPMDGTVRCDGNQIQQCGKWSGECRSWRTIETCTGNSRCEQSECVGSCEDQCQSGQKRCNNNTVQVCIEGKNGCLKWSNRQTCDDGSYCSGGKCVQEKLPFPGKKEGCANCRIGAIRDGQGERDFEFCVDIEGDGCSNWYPQSIVDTYSSYHR